MIKICKICSVEFDKPKSVGMPEWNRRISCSRKCAHIYKSQQMKGKMPKNIKLIAGNLKGKGKWYLCKGCKKQFQSRPELKHVKTSYCTRECWLTNAPKEFKPHPLRGEKHHYWKGGINKENSKIRTSLQHKEWRYKVLERDNHTCVNCGSKENIWVDHIKPFSLYPELRFDINNGRALCRPCDIKIGYSYFKENNPRKRINVETA